MIEQETETGSPEGHATVLEVHAAIESLSDADLDRLSVISRSLVKSFPRLARAAFMDEDLVQESIRRALTGSRRWQRGTSFMKFLAFTMVSVAKDEAKKVSKRREDAIGLFLSAETMGGAMAFLRELRAMDDWRHLQSFFADDPAAWRMVEGMGEEREGEDLRTFCGLPSGTAFATVQKRVRRKLNSYIELGGYRT